MTPPDCTPLHLSRRGQGEPLLLLHGFGSTSDDFAALLDDLAADFDVLAVDLPGHGGSPALDRRPTVAALTSAVEATLDAEGVGDCHVLGNSLGARIGIELARRERALSVVALSPSGLGTPAERVHQAALMITARTVNQLRAPWAERLAATTLGRAALLAGMRAQPWRASAAEALTMRDGFARQQAFWPTLTDAILLDIPTGLDEIGCPVVVAQGVFDVIGSGQTPRFTPFIPGARFVPLPLAGHAPQSDAPETIVRLVRQAARSAAERAAIAA